MDSVKELLQLIIASASVSVAFLLYKLNANLRRDNWAKTLRDFHQFFWTNKEIEEVRLWIACDEAYEKVRPILEKRKKNEPISSDEYSNYIEKIDKFAALITAYKKLEPDDLTHKAVTKRVFDEYWLGSLTVRKRQEMRDYIKMFYKELEDSLPDE